MHGPLPLLDTKISLVYIEGNDWGFIIEIQCLHCRYIYLGLFKSEVEAARSLRSWSAPWMKFFIFTLQFSKTSLPVIVQMNTGLMTKPLSEVMEGKPSQILTQVHMKRKWYPKLREEVLFYLFYFILFIAFICWNV